MVMAEGSEKGLSKGLPISKSPTWSTWARNVDMHKSMASWGGECGSSEYLTVILFRLCTKLGVGKAAFPHVACQVRAL